MKGGHILDIARKNRYYLCKYARTHLEEDELEEKKEGMIEVEKKLDLFLNELQNEQTSR